VQSWSVESTVASLFASRAAVDPERRCITDGGRARSYREVRDRVSRLAGVLRAHGVRRGDRIAVLSRNRAEYLETFLAAAWIGAVVACQNWRLAEAELAHTLDLVSPTLLLASPELAERLSHRSEPVHRFGEDHEAALKGAEPVDQPAAIDPGAPLLVLYTSGTTGLPKGAVISHRTQIVRNLVTRAEYGIAPADAFVAWSPMYHMGGAEYALGTLMSGGTVHVVDGFDEARLAELVASEPLGWLLLMPGMVGRFADRLEHEGVRPVSVRVCGVMADLVPPADIARITRLLDAPYANTFGATETGNPPASSALLEPGVEPRSLDKVQSPFCEVRLVDAEGRDVPEGEPGELWMRGPTLFSGYFRDDAANAEAFAGGWFHMGDVFVRNPDGTLRFVDRRKYMIKTGGENVYPAEIERVLLAQPGVTEAAVVRRSDPKWGEVPVAFVARSDDRVSTEQLVAACEGALARYKKPKDVVFIGYDEFPRSASGKVRRHDLEARAETS